MRYYFHVRDGSVLYLDEEGDELATHEEAHAVALECARDLLADDLRAKKTPSDIRQIEVFGDREDLIEVVPVRVPHH